MKVGAGAGAGASVGVGVGAGAGAGAGAKTGTKDEVHAVSETGQNITVKVNKTLEEIHGEKQHVEGKMEEYLKKNPKKHDAGK